METETAAAAEKKPVAATAAAGKARAEGLCSAICACERGGLAWENAGEMELEFGAGCALASCKGRVGDGGRVVVLVVHVADGVGVGGSTCPCVYHDGGET